MKIDINECQEQMREQALDSLDQVIAYLKQTDQRKLVMMLRDVENYIKIN